MGINCVGRCETFHAATWLSRRVLSTDDTTQAVKATRRQISVWRNTLLAHGLDLKRLCTKMLSIWDR